MFPVPSLKHAQSCHLPHRSVLGTREGERETVICGPGPHELTAQSRSPRPPSTGLVGLWDCKQRVCAHKSRGVSSGRVTASTDCAEGRWPGAQENSEPPPGGMCVAGLCLPHGLVSPSQGLG